MAREGRGGGAIARLLGTRATRRGLARRAGALAAHAPLARAAPVAGMASPGVAPLGSEPDPVAGSLAALARLRTAPLKRLSSYDRGGGYHDYLPVPAGGRVNIAEVLGAGVVTHIWLTMLHQDPLSRRNVVLRMYWDGEPTPSVESPLGDFFGQGWGASYPYAALPLAAAPSAGAGLNCFFPMPFADGARIELENQSDRPLERLYFHVDYEKHAGIGEDLGRFHAWWNREPTEARSGGSDRWGSPGAALAHRSDRGNYLVLEAAGRGHYVGVNYYVDNPSPEWYGEGDDVFLVDGEPWPGSLHGTGTEDYFGTAWNPSGPYQHPYFGYALVDHPEGWRGCAHAYRFDLEGPVPFRRSLRVSFEHGHANVRALDLASVAYWYQAEPHRPFPPLPEKAARQPTPLAPGEDAG